MPGAMRLTLRVPPPSVSPRPASSPAACSRTSSATGTDLSTATNAVTSFNASNSGAGVIKLSDSVTTLTITGISDTTAGGPITITNERLPQPDGRNQRRRQCHQPDGQRH